MLWYGEVNPVPIAALDVIFHDVLEEVRNRNNTFIGRDVVINDEYYRYRSLRRVSTTQARNKEEQELEITTANIWRNTERI